LLQNLNFQNNTTNFEILIIFNYPIYHACYFSNIITIFLYYMLIDIKKIPSTNPSISSNQQFSLCCNQIVCHLHNYHDLKTFCECALCVIFIITRLCMLNFTIIYSTSSFHYSTCVK
jgi:hypothetical protein